ncbi:MAG: SAM-dependent methyltransferase [Zoogloeaceae bacterium]|nr:SAM-dependent methyltransferase [Zoogloeaceae bacterium]
MDLPAPSPDALKQSTALAERIRRLIHEQGGWLSFTHYMEAALYTPGLGYYSGGAQKFGPAGDFVTAPEITPLFGRSLARQVADILTQSAPVVLEVGAGTGLLAADILTALDEVDAAPERYFILEVSGELRARQFDTLAAKAPGLADRVVWLDDLPRQFSGAVVANEVLDVMPVHLVVSQAGGLAERGVALDGAGALVWQDQALEGAALGAAQAIGLPRPETGEYVTELGLAGAAWMREWAGRLVQGALLLIDYGYPRAEYYLPHRSRGTLQCYYRHRAHDEPLRWPGLNDITSFVDFTAVADAAFDSGLEIYGYTSQAQFLFNCGVLDFLAARGPEGTADYIRAARAVQRLTTPQEMGELFKVLAAGKGMTTPLRGFTHGDRTHTL